MLAVRQRTSEIYCPNRVSMVEAGGCAWQSLLLL
jgi:hypothetical protein